MVDPLPAPALPCPECRERHAGGMARIGNNRGQCTTCNNFAQNVMRVARKRLKEEHEEEYWRIRLRVEMDLYPQVIETYKQLHPRARRAQKEIS